MPAAAEVAAAPLVGRSAPIEHVRRQIHRASRHRLPVLLLGETGTGKEVAARAIHETNPRGRFVPIDCGSLVGSLMESELFGHIKGAFSGAASNQQGLVELADGGTAFFDEIGDLPLEMQVKLLRLVQEREFRPVGSPHWRKADIRIIAATHRNLKKEIAAGRFREDLYYRLNVVPIHLPPLRERKEDIPLLIDHFLQMIDAPGLDLSSIRSALLNYDWPGNVRELRHAVERIAAMRTESAPELLLPTALQNHLAASNLDRLSESIEDAAELPEFSRLPSSPVISIRESEKQAIQAALAAAMGDRSKAAGILRIGRTTLYRKMKQYGID
jgi:DNA-binding NtrC family response regulator